MSNTGFMGAESRPMPKLVCAGRVQNVEAGRVTKSGDYLMVPIEIEGYGAARNIKQYWCFRPEWLVAGFNPIALRDAAGGDKLLGVYRNNVAEDGGISTLLGLCGCDAEKFDTLATTLFDLKISDMTVKNAETGTSGLDIDLILDKVSVAFHEFFIDGKNGEHVGYILKQEFQKTDEVNADGKAVYKATRFYGVNDWFDPNDEKRLKALRKSCEKSGGKMQMRIADGNEVPY